MSVHVHVMFRDARGVPPSLPRPAPPFAAGGPPHFARRGPPALLPSFRRVPPASVRPSNPSKRAAMFSSHRVGKWVRSAATGEWTRPITYDPEQPPSPYNARCNDPNGGGHSNSGVLKAICICEACYLPGFEGQVVRTTRLRDEKDALYESFLQYKVLENDKLTEDEKLWLKDYSVRKEWKERKAARWDPEQKMKDRRASLAGHGARSVVSSTIAAFNETKQPDGKQQVKPKETTNRKAAAPLASTKGKTKVTPGIKKATPRVTPRAKRGMHE